MESADDRGRNHKVSQNRKYLVSVIILIILVILCAFLLIADAEQQQQQQQQEQQHNANHQQHPATQLEEHAEQLEVFAAKKRENSSSEIVNIVYASDIYDFIPLLASINSLLNYSSQECLQRLRIFIFTSPEHLSMLQRKLICASHSNPEFSKVSFVLQSFNLSLSSLKRDGHKKVHRPELINPMNFARYYVPHELPYVDKFIWLDADTIIIDSICPLFASQLTRGLSSPLLAAVPRGIDIQQAGIHLNSLPVGLRHKYSSRQHAKPTFNAGVLVVNSAKWREEQITKEAERWINWGEKYKLWSQPGSQPPLLALFVVESNLFGDFEQAEKGWNADGFSWIKDKKVLPRDKIIHFTGSKKPWFPIGMHKDLWLPHYQPLAHCFTPNETASSRHLSRFAHLPSSASLVDLLKSGRVVVHKRRFSNRK